MKKFLISTFASIGLVGAAFAAGGGEQHIDDIDFTFEGPFGYFDQHQLQRGLQVYTEVCSACHGLKYVGFYALDDEGGPHLPEDQVRAYAQQFEVWDANKRESVQAEYANHFPESNDPKAPDLSLMAKARAGFHGPHGLGINQIVKGMGGAEYIYSVLTGYNGHEIEEAGSVFYENTAFGGGKISMAPPLSDGIVDYALEDEAFETVAQYAEDVSAFLMWAAEPKLEARKSGGFLWTLLLAMTTIFLWFGNKLLWYPIKHPKK